MTALLLFSERVLLKTAEHTTSQRALLQFGLSLLQLQRSVVRFRKVVQQSRSYFHDFRGEPPNDLCISVVLVKKQVQACCFLVEHTKKETFFVLCSVRKTVITRSRIFSDKKADKINYYVHSVVCLKIKFKISWRGTLSLVVKPSNHQ